MAFPGHAGRPRRSAVTVAASLWWGCRPMTVQRGQEWGTTVPRPDGLVVASSDAELAQLATAEPAGDFGLAAGDLHRAIGAPAPRDPLQRLPIDALRVSIDGRQLLAVAHVIVMRSFWRGPIIAVMNCDHLGAWDMAPRAHPNDGRFDVVEFDRAMSTRSRWQARSRLRQGTHVPHPDIATRTALHAEWNLERPTPIRVDGVPRGRVLRLVVDIAPDHFAIHV